NGSFDPDDDPITLGLNPSGPYPLGDTPITLTVTADSGEEDTCTAIVTVIDDTPPVITCPLDQTCQADENCACTVPDLCSLAIVTDNCDLEPVCSQDPAAGTSITLGDTPVTLTAIDEAGNSYSCQVTITVVDTTPPEIICPPNQTILADENWEATVPDLCALATITDNCDTEPICEQDIPAGVTIFGGNTIVKLTATDEAGNSSSCEVTITVIVPLNLDIKPDSCPSPLNMNTNNKGRIKVALLGSDKFDVSKIDINSIAVAGVVFPPKTPTTMDVGTPRPDSQQCECRGHKKDGINDLLIHFPRKEIVLALGLYTIEPHTVVPITVEGNLLSGVKFVATDCVKLVGRKD
ncbi:MAG: HYR domain-containing protein, partial [Planctomycetota bacterium]